VAATLPDGLVGQARVEDMSPRDVAASLAAELADFIYALRLRPDVRFEYISPNVEDVTGIAAERFYAEPTLAESVLNEVDPSQLDPVRQASPGSVVSFTVEGSTPDGTSYWTEHHSRVIRHADGRDVMYGAARNVTARRQAEDSLMEERERYRLLAENSLDVVYRIDPQGHITWISPSVTAVLGWSSEALLGTSVEELIHPADIEGVRRAQLDLLAAGLDTGEGELRIATVSGGWRWMRVVGRVLRGEDGEILGGVDELRDIQNEVETRLLLEREVGFDALTGLPKRAMFLVRVQEMLDLQDVEEGAMLCVGIDDLSSVNEVYLHTAGDRVITTVAERLESAVAVPDLIGRIGGDEFAVFIPDASTLEQVELAVERIQSSIRGLVSIGPHDLDVTATVGVAMAGKGDSAELLRDAATGQHQSSARGKDRWDFFDSQLATDARRQLRVHHDLRQALRHDHIVPWFQPIVSLRDGRLEGYEALARWMDEDGGVLEPSEFLDVAERAGVTDEIDRHVLSRALSALRHVPDDRYVAVNLSADSLRADDYASLIRDELRRYKIHPTRLHLEITETSLVRVTESLTAQMRSLADLGVTWWVDDFGTGFSSVSHLRDLPIAGLKLDRSFTAGVGEGDQTSLRLAQGLAGLAHGLGLDTVAEGIETEAEAMAMASLGWAKGQGWHFGEATPTMLDEHHGHVAER
jgi:diguanylate cyclase (GGDEF)-like protein/PAS domain S-box-containing protein